LLLFVTSSVVYNDELELQLVTIVALCFYSLRNRDLKCE
jgi:hypothetical protein